MVKIDRCVIGVISGISTDKRYKNLDNKYFYTSIYHNFKGDIEYKRLKPDLIKDKGINEIKIYESAPYYGHGEDLFIDLSSKINSENLELLNGDSFEYVCDILNKYQNYIGKVSPTLMLHFGKLFYVEISVDIVWNDVGKFLDTIKRLEIKSGSYGFRKIIIKNTLYYKKMSDADNSFQVCIYDKYQDFLDNPDKYPPDFDGNRLKGIVRIEIRCEGLNTIRKVLGMRQLCLNQVLYADINPVDRFLRKNLILDYLNPVISGRKRKIPRSKYTDRINRLLDEIENGDYNIGEERVVNMPLVMKKLKSIVGAKSLYRYANIVRYNLRIRQQKGVIEQDREIVAELLAKLNAE